MNYTKNITGKVTRWFSYNEMINFCENLTSIFLDGTEGNLADKIIMVNNESNTIANPRSVLNLLRLQLQNGNNVEIIIISETETRAEMLWHRMSPLLDGIIEFGK